MPPFLLEGRQVHPFSTPLRVPGEILGPAVGVILSGYTYGRQISTDQGGPLVVRAFRGFTGGPVGDVNQDSPAKERAHDVQDLGPKMIETWSASRIRNRLRESES